jgi:hypothetical protein
VKEERRGSFRSVPQKGLEVRLTAPEHAGSKNERYNLAARLLDLSSKGACLVTFEKLSQGSPAVAELFIPGRDVQFTTKATVCWATSLRDGGHLMHVAGISFAKSFRGERAVRSDRAREVLPAAADPSPSEATPTSRSMPSRGPEPQRSHKRFTPEEVTLVCFQRGFLRAVGLASNTARRLKDLSRTGAQIACAGRLKAGERVDLRLEFARSKIVLELEAIVRWCRRDTTSLEPRYLAGVSFENLAEGAERQIRTIEGMFLGF